MLVSEITVEEVKNYLRASDDTETNFDAILAAAKAYVIGQTGLAITDLNSYDDITIAVLVLCSDMYENRTMAVDKSNVNRVVDSIIGMHSRNLL